LSNEFQSHSHHLVLTLTFISDFSGQTLRPTAPTKPLQWKRLSFGKFGLHLICGFNEKAYSITLLFKPNLLNLSEFFKGTGFSPKHFFECDELPLVAQR